VGAPHLAIPMALEELDAMPVTLDNTSAHDAAVVLHSDDPGLRFLLGTRQSGKTTMLLLYARFLASQGEQVVLVDFNGVLTGTYYVHQLMMDFEDYIRVFRTDSFSQVSGHIRKNHKARAFYLVDCIDHAFDKMNVQSADEANQWFKKLHKTAASSVSILGTVDTTTVDPEVLDLSLGDFPRVSIPGNPEKDMEPTRYARDASLGYMMEM